MTGEQVLILGGLVLAAVAVALMGRRLMRFTVSLFGFKVAAERERPNPAGVRITGSSAGRHIVADSVGGGTTIDRSTAAGDIRASADLSEKPDDKQPG